MDRGGLFWRQRRTRLGPVYPRPGWGRTYRTRRPRRRLPGGPWLTVLLLLGAALAAFVLERPAAGPIAGAGPFRLCAAGERVTCVVDGDTLHYGGATIRLADIDAPEIFSPKCAAEKELGERATRRLLELMNAGPFELAPSGSRDTDRYGRELRVVTRDGRSLADILVAEGLARPWDGARRSWCG